MENNNVPNNIGLVYHPTYLLHETRGHAENKLRLLSILKYLEQSKIKNNLFYIPPRYATVEEIGLIHPLTYIKMIERACQTNKRSIDPDTQICPKSYEVALLAAGGVISAIDAVMEGKVKQAFALVRPPGHHAEPNKGMGFCIFNNIAIGTKYAQNKYGLEKILIIDFDVHHGNGTQLVFYDDPSVLYCSIHQYPFYPGTGTQLEKGEGKGERLTINVPLPAKTGDIEYIAAFKNYILPPALEFNPELVLVSAGFDGHKDDPIGGMKLTNEGYKNIAKMICEIANQSCEGKVVSCLEGGYNIEVLPVLVEEYLLEMLNSGR
ncbi:MAG: histone deacetylase [Nitrospirota bacterium]